MDDSKISEAVMLTPSSQEATYTTSSAGSELGSPSQQSKVQSSEKSSEVADEGIDDADVRLIEQITSSSGQPPINRPGDMPMSTPVSGEQYTPLVQLMVPPPSSVPPPRPPPPSAKPRKNPKGHKGKGCYSQLAENVAVELASMNERLHQKLRSSFEMLQAKENDVQELGEVEEDSYVFVNQQGELIKILQTFWFSAPISLKILKPEKLKFSTDLLPNAIIIVKRVYALKQSAAQ